LGRPLLIVVCVFALTVCTVFTTQAGRTEILSLPANDIVRLSESWWGTSIDDFPIKAGLRPGEYSITDNPTKAREKIIMISIGAASRFEPSELPAYALYFNYDNLLYEISWFIKGTIEEVLIVLTNRYGKPNSEIQVIGMKAYSWSFDNTSLELRHNLYQLIPKK